MGEAAACLLRSFSHPSEGSLKAEQGDPIRVLGESISLGRFMSESLAWEKWSSFSQNRYLEEVQKFSKPGSVAQKKAYFEAHYKKKALQRETNFVEETNAQSAIVTLAQTEEKSSPSEFTREKSGDIVDKDTTPEINVSDEESVSLIDANVGDSSVDKRLGESSESKEEEEAAILQTKNTEDCEAAMEFSKGRNEILESGGEERRLPSKKRLAVSSLKLGHQIGAASKLPPNPATKANLLPRQMNNALSKSMKATDYVLEKKRLTATAKSLHSSINFPSDLRKSNEIRLAVSTQNPRPKIGASKRPSDPTAMKTASRLPRQMNNAFSKISKPKDHVLEKARLPATAKSLHASINFPSALAKSNKPISFSQSAPRVGGPQKDIPKARKTPLKASENRISKTSPVKTRPKDRRILSQSVSVLDRKLKSSARLSSAPTASSSFNFRIEERALKRKEFFQKLEEKAMETKKELQTKYKNKTATNNEKRLQSTSAMAKPSENPRRRPPFPSNHVRKVVKNGLELCNFSKVAREPAKSYVSNNSYSVPPRRSTTKSDRSEKTRWK